MDITRLPSQRTVEFAIYRDGDNNLDASQGITLRQALETSAKDAHIEFTVQDTTSRGSDALHTDAFTIADGAVHRPHIGAPQDMASEENLARFVATALDNAQASGAAQTWLELTNHGAGDGGGLEADSAHGIMSMPNIAQAIADGIALHAQEHPEDAHRNIDGVVANQCLMASMGFADALSHAGVKYLEASPETMVSPGVPSDVAHAIAANASSPVAMANAVVRDVMDYRYGMGSQHYGPAAAFDVLDLDARKIATAEHAIATFNDDVAAHKSDTSMRAALRDDVRSVDGMVRFPEATPDMPWHADRPAIAMYDAIARDARLDASIRNEAAAAETAVRNLVLAHGESTSYAPFDGSSYRDAVGPTIHAPVNARQVDPWAPAVSETDNAFYRNVDENKFAQVIA